MSMVAARLFFDFIFNYDASKSNDKYCDIKEQIIMYLLSNCDDVPLYERYDYIILLFSHIVKS